MAKEKVVRSFADLVGIMEDKLEAPKKEERIPVEKIEKVKKEKELYESSNIRIKGTQLATTDGCYETYSLGRFTSWRVTMIGQKNGSIDIGNNIDEGYTHGSFHNRDRAASILVEMINRHKVA